jgi:large subunit ribosomal protein L15
MQAHQLKPPPGARHARKRVGRGNAGGQGTYAGRGLKGQKARAGNKPRRFFEGGQTRLFKKLPFRRGFTNPFRVEYQPVNLSDLERLDGEVEITPDLLKERGVLRNLRKPVKVLASGELTKKLIISAHAFSVTAKEKIEAAGGTVVELSERKKKRRDRSNQTKTEDIVDSADQAEVTAQANKSEQAESGEETAGETAPEGEGDGSDG